MEPADQVVQLITQLRNLIHKGGPNDPAALGVTQGLLDKIESFGGDNSEVKTLKSAIDAGLRDWFGSKNPNERNLTHGEAKELIQKVGALQLAVLRYIKAAKK